MTSPENTCTRYDGSGGEPEPTDADWDAATCDNRSSVQGEVLQPSACYRRSVWGADPQLLSPTLCGEFRKTSVRRVSPQLWKSPQKPFVRGVFSQQPLLAK